MAPPTVLFQKSDFLGNQTRLLAQPLSPSRVWLNANDVEDGLPKKVVDDALYRLNHAIQQHSRRVYAPQAVRHVAEQIDKLYWDAAERAAESRRRADTEGIDSGMDLTDAEAIDSLPQTWGSEREAGSYPAEAKRYSELVERLQALNAQRARIKADTNRLRHIHDLLQPFKSDDEGYGVQENLITRGGEVEVELERMRMLLARVGARLGHLLEQDGQTTSSSLHKDDGAFMVDHVEVEEKRKVDDLLMHF